MKVIQALLLACFFSLAGNAQVVVVSPTGDGGFETGGTFAANGWTVVNPATVVHQWVLTNNAPAYGGGLSAHVSNNGSAYAYTPTGGARTCHFYRDITIPAGATSIMLSFYWKGNQSVSADRMFVSTGATTVVPIANFPVSPSTTMTGATVEWLQTTSTSTYTLVNQPLSTSLAGTTFRLIFTWQNDASTGTTPPVSVDNISVTYECVANDPVVGTSVMCEGTTTTMTSGPSGGTWSSSNPTVGTVSPLGEVNALSAGTTTISYYTSSCAPPATLTLTVIATPSAISGPANICLGYAAVLTNTATGGGWTSSDPSHVSVNPITGVIVGSGLGTATISYGNGCGSPATYVVTTNPNPPASTGPDSVCEGGATITMFNAFTGGTWSAFPTSIATASTTGAGDGLITGVSDGTATITFTSSVGCITTTTITVQPLPPAIVGLAPLCVSDNITLTNPLPGGVWSSSVMGVANITSGGTVFGIVGGTSVISYTNGCGSATVIVTVDPEPLPIVGDSTVCVGNTTTFADVIIGGTWSSGFPAIATVLTSSGVITGVSSGDGIITYTMPGGCFAVRPVHVVDPPTAISGSYEVCPGGTTALSNSTPGGTWLSLNPGSATISSTGTVTGITADTALIEYTTPAGCRVYATITINPNPGEIIGRGTYCAKDIDTLFNPDGGGVWSSLNTSVATVGGVSGVMTTVFGGVVTIRYTLATTCSTTRTFTVDPLPTPVVSFNGPTNTFRTDSTYASYQWYHSIHGKLPGATIYKVAGLYNGSYFVTVTDAKGCIGSSLPVAYSTFMGVGVVPGQEDARIFPNPAFDIVNIESAQSLRAIISSMDGKVVIDQPNAKTVDIARLPGGVYTISLYNEQGIKITVEKLIKQ